MAQKSISNSEVSRRHFWAMSFGRQCGRCFRSGSAVALQSILLDSRSWDRISAANIFGPTTVTLMSDCFGTISWNVAGARTSPSSSARSSSDNCVVNIALNPSGLFTYPERTALATNSWSWDISETVPGSFVVAVRGVRGVREIDRSLEQWQMGVKDLRRRMILAPTPRERWYAILLLAQGLTAAATAEALERDPHTIGRWASAFGEGGPAALIFEQTGGSPPPLTRRSKRS